MRLPLDRPLIGFIGRFYGHQGVENFIAAAPYLVSRVPEALFPIVGYGPLEERYRHLVKEKGLENHFVFPGPAGR